MTYHANPVPQALTIAGSDSGGGAGIQADLKTFQERRVFGTSVIVAVTAQNTLGVQGIHKVPVEMVTEQLHSVFDDFDITALKTGMLPDADIMRAVAAELAKHPEIPVVVDPVMIAKGGASLMENEAAATLVREILPLATVLTPNVPEAEVITGMTITDSDGLLAAAKKIQAMGAKNIVIKGGHRIETTDAEDVLLTAEGEVVKLASERIDTVRTHGTGCTYSACITAELAKGRTIKDAVTTAKAYIAAAISDGILVGHGHGPTNHWAYRKV
ncbi:MAG: bifunctional hydroxymethylpyrimidine kinase/phosphomethylpyrimidine kinase [Peptococcaceae bacterium]|nr:bifunctional hydroxymethylpyrimidine kinase/phosphomethylpyrimidine kinase [Peptococcaceae bacterium]